MAKKNNFTKYLIIGIVVLLGGAFILSKMASNDGDEGVVLENRFMGGENAAVVLTEYSDFECPACRAAHPVVKEIVEEFGNDLKFEYKHFPLTQIHQNANLAAQAAEAAGVQGKFWEMHDLIFEEQPVWSRSPNPKGNFIAFAEELELDVEQFKRQINSSLIKAKIRDDQALGQEQGVRGTPSFFLNGEALQNPGSAEDFKNIIRTAITNAGGSTGTSTDTMMESDENMATDTTMMEEESGEAMMEESTTSTEG